jgi:hypothetical protein
VIRIALIFQIGGADQREIILVWDRKDDALVGILENIGVRMIEQARHHDVAAFYQAQAMAVFAFVFGGPGAPCMCRIVIDAVRELRGPRPGRIDNRARINFVAHALFVLQYGAPGFVAFIVAGTVAIAFGRDAFGARHDARTEFTGVQCVQHHQPGVVDPAVGILEAALIIAFQRRTGNVARQRNRARCRQEAPPRHVVIQEQAGAHHPGRTLAGVVRHHKSQRTDNVRCGAQQDFALLQCLPHQREFVILQVTQTAVNQLGAGRRGVLRQIVLFAKNHFQSTPHRIAGNADAVDAATNDQQVAGAFLRCGWRRWG